MPRKKSLIPSKRFRLDGYIPMQAEGVTRDVRDQVFHDWLADNRGQAATMARQIITSMLHGELGSQVQAAVVKGNTEETIEALQDLIGAWGEDPPVVEYDDIPPFIPTGVNGGNGRRNS